MDRCSLGLGPQVLLCPRRQQTDSGDRAGVPTRASWVLPPGAPPGRLLGEKAPVSPHHARTSDRKRGPKGQAVPRRTRRAAVQPRREGRAPWEEAPPPGSPGSGQKPSLALRETPLIANLRKDAQPCEPGRGWRSGRGGVGWAPAPPSKAPVDQQGWGAKVAASRLSLGVPLGTEGTDCRSGVLMLKQKLWEGRLSVKFCPQPRLTLAQTGTQRIRGQGHHTEAVSHPTR